MAAIFISTKTKEGESMAEKAMTQPSDMPKAVLQRLRMLKQKLDSGNVTALSDLCSQILKGSHYHSCMVRLGIVGRDDEKVWHWNAPAPTKKIADKVYSESVQHYKMLLKKNARNAKHGKGISVSVEGGPPNPENQSTEQSKSASALAEYLKRTEARQSSMESDIQRIKIALFDLTMDKRLLEANSTE